MDNAELIMTAKRNNLTLRPYPIEATAKCAVSGCDSPKGKTKFFCIPWVSRHILNIL